MAQHQAPWSSKAETPRRVQTGFGRFGDKLPLDGEISCGTTAMTMSVMWLIDNGFDELVPSTRCTRDELATELVRAFEGLEKNPFVRGRIYDELWYRYVIETYLSLKGIGPSHRKIDRQISPTIPWLNEHNQDQTIVNFAIGWYNKDVRSQRILSRDGQHWLTLIQAHPANGLLSINNPYPGSLKHVPNVRSEVRQEFRTAKFDEPTDPRLPRGDYIQITNGIFGPRSLEHAVLETAYAVKIDGWGRAAPHHAPEPFELTRSLYVNSGLATLDVLAPLRGRGGLMKWGQKGEVILKNTNTTLGGNEIHEGTLVSTQSAGTPFGAGSITLCGSGGLALRPDYRSGEGVTFAVAGGPRSHVTFGGGNRIEFQRRDNASITVTLGGRRDGRTPNLRRSGTGTLRIVPGSGLSELGRSERLLVVGSKGNLPRVANGMVEPSIIGRDLDGSGAFLSYEMNGFVRAATTSSRNIPITQSTPTTVYSVEDTQVIPGGHAVSAYAVCVGPRHSVKSGGPHSTLRLDDGDPSGTAGLILNGGRVKAATLEFGGARGLIHTSRAGGKITSDIRGRRGATFFGASRLRLTGHNSYSGGTVIDSGLIVVANTTGTGLGTGDVQVVGGAKLIVDGKAAHVAGKITLQPNSSLLLRGGTIGALKMVYGDYENVGGLRGFGTIAGKSEISGMVRGAGQIGVLTFQDHVTFRNTSFYWTLSALDAEAGHEGVFWNSLEFNGTTRFAAEDFWIFVNFTRATPDPNSDVPFWGQAHRWLLARFNANRPLQRKRMVAPYHFQYTAGNFKEFRRGSFGIKRARHEVYLTYTPRRSTSESVSAKSTATSKGIARPSAKSAAAASTPSAARRRTM